MSLFLLVLGLIIAVGSLVALPQIPNNALRGATVVAGFMILVLCTIASSVRHVPDDQVGIIIKKIGFSKLPAGQILATNGEMGPQAMTLGPGWHPGYWPIFFDIEYADITDIKSEQVGLITTIDGQPLPKDSIYATEWATDEFKSMLQAEYFLTTGNGIKGPQASVLTPGQYRLNTRLFQIKMVPVTNIEKATVGVVKSNVGEPPASEDVTENRLVSKGQRGIWNVALSEQKINLHSEAYEVTPVSLARTVINYTKGSANENREITVRSSDGFTFPVDVRIEYAIKPEDAPMMIASLGGETERLLDLLNSAVRAIFRNNAESVKALDYVQQRSQQESASLQALADEMIKIGVTVTGVRIGDVGDEASLGKLLKTQMEREIANQEKLTFEIQQEAQEKKKELSRTEQEAEEEKRLATAMYEVQIAEADKEKRIIEAGAEAEAITIKAKAQADAYQMIAQEIGKGNAALVELLKIIGESGINITPRVMVSGSGSGGSASDDATTALIGTMLDSMVNKVAEEDDNANDGG